MSEMDKLENYLVDHSYIYDRRDLPEYEGEQIIVFNEYGRQWDAVCHKFSMGHKDRLLEIMGTIVRSFDDEVEGYLTAEDVIKRLEENKLR